MFILVTNFIVLYIFNGLSYSPLFRCKREDKSFHQIKPSFTDASFSRTYIIPFSTAATGALLEIGRKYFNCSDFGNQNGSAPFIRDKVIA